MLLRSTLIYAPAILLTRVSALLLLVVMTRMLSQVEYGLLTLVVTVGEMTDGAVTNWLRIALLRLGGKGEVSRGSLVLAGRALIAATVLALAVAAGAATLIEPARWIEFAIAVGGYLVAGAVGRFALTVLQMQQRHGLYSRLEYLRGVLQLVLPVAAVFLFEGSFLTVSLASSLGALIAGIVAGVVAARRVVAGPARFTRREFVALGGPFIVMALVGFGMNNVERLFLNAWYGAGAVAVFAASYALARQPIDMIANAINIGAFPEIVNRFDEDGPQAAGQLLSELMALVLRLCLPVAVMLVALSDEITRLLLPADYRGRFELLFAIIAFSVLSANLVNFVFGVVMHAHKRPWLLIAINFLGSIGTVSLSFLLIPVLAEVGAALALAGGSLVSLIASIVIGRRLIRVPAPWRDVAASIVIAAGTGLAAALAARALAAAPVFAALAAGLAAGGAGFLALVWAFHPAATALFIDRLKARLPAR
ncbi:lipopolysaccharide biosynthesis protein [Bosea sp. (in: a-proteobacteria)]|uniref:lipopolysaccharide biosynthesis protein n=1 Tax=Bosea sp. (in: a-proteobacteria) TaxID=1871050 RepID=UPI00260C89FE|nr:polysaccharide biosynthesis C-terminal domain-containing protein [Bosea sp. (in: a-proteobacteria)]MCO5090851.1 polysaccharide biosynthesis C-terminal domain-containing protein [Bosea sp. (in: a-proteobacteria)]